MNEIILGGLDKLEVLEKEFGIVGSIVAIVILLIVTAITVLGIYTMLKFWLYAIELLVPIIFKGWKI